jgi:putative autotransporter adhesin-like protein
VGTIASVPASRFWSRSRSAVLTVLGAVIIVAASASGQTESTHPLAIDSFERVYLSGPIRVHLQQQNQTADPARQAAAPGAFIQGPTASVEQLKIEQSDATLYIDLPAGAAHNNEADLTVYLPFKKLKEVVSQGGARVFADQIQSANLALEGRGEGQFVLQRVLVDDLVIVGQGNTMFVLSGTVQHQLIEIAGLGRFHGAALQSETSHISVQGAGEVDVWARELLQVDVSGTAKVRYDGTPWIHQQIQGSGAITRLF